MISDRPLAKLGEEDRPHRSCISLAPVVISSSQQPPATSRSAASH
ncbi:hypothetical protein QUA13_10590 [Microcoleus sp. S28C3]